MKTEDFERLKSHLGDEFTAEYRVEKDKVMVLVTKKDEWEGVEFVEFNNGSIKKIGSITDFMIYASDGRYGAKTNCKPSTEQAYIEQLKKEAFERFGEIKEGDEFVEADGDKWITKRGFKKCGNLEWHYIKENDILFHYALIIYQQGKWAERVKERIFIRWEECDGNYIKFSYSGSVNLIPRMNELSALLEKYLNNEL